LKEIEAAVEIFADCHSVWKTLLDFQSYPEWNPYIRYADGSAISGQKITIRTQPPGARSLVFHPRLIVVEPNRELTWIGSSLPHFLFAGQHSFLLQSQEDGKTRFIQKERFTGLLVPFVSNIIVNRTLTGFHLMNEALKKRVESTDGIFKK